MSFSRQLGTADVVSAIPPRYSFIFLARTLWSSGPSFTPIAVTQGVIMGDSYLSGTSSVISPETEGSSLLRRSSLSILPDPRLTRQGHQKVSPKYAKKKRCGKKRTSGPATVFEKQLYWIAHVPYNLEESETFTNEPNPIPS